MPITISYDLRTENNNHHSYVRSMFERFNWDRLGGSVFRYDELDDTGQEDWLNEVIPALMLFRSYCLANVIEVSFFTLDTNSVTRIDASDPGVLLGTQPLEGENLNLVTPTNVQSSVERIRRAVTAVADLFRPVPEAQK